MNVPSGFLCNGQKLEEKKCPLTNDTMDIKIVVYLESGMLLGDIKEYTT